MASKRPPVHPGEILREEFLAPLKLTPYAVAAALHVPRTRIERIAGEEKPVTADAALRLGKFFKTGPTVEDALAPQIKKIASMLRELRKATRSSLATSIRWKRMQAI